MRVLVDSDRVRQREPFDRRRPHTRPAREHRVAARQPSGRRRVQIRFGICEERPHQAHGGPGRQEVRDRPGRQRVRRQQDRVGIDFRRHIEPVVLDPQVVGRDLRHRLGEDRRLQRVVRDQRDLHRIRRRAQPLGGQQPELGHDLGEVAEPAGRGEAELPEDRVHDVGEGRRERVPGVARVAQRLHELQGRGEVHGQPDAEPRPLEPLAGTRRQEIGQPPSEQRCGREDEVG